MQYGPYHLARALALQEAARPMPVRALELANLTKNYAWSREAKSIELVTLCPEMVSEKLSFQAVFQRARQCFKELEVGVCLLPSYSPRQPLAALLAAKSLGIKTVMMNESHAGTARAGRAGTWAKRRLVSLFDAALVGGAPQKRYFASLGLPEEKIFTGYDAVDNDYFTRKAADARSQSAEIRNQYGLPEHYFLSLGRFVAKKNLDTLLQAFRKFLDSQPRPNTHLVMVGSGEEETKLISLCAGLKLPVCDHRRPDANALAPGTPQVHFYGFRQIDENPIFYALADAFILPSLYEEWGLVVNEAMAAGLPVVVSETAGCAEDLLENDPEPLADLRPVTELRSRDSLKRGARRNGFVFAPNSADELAAVLQILAAQPALCREMGAAGREIVEKFSCRQFAENALLAAEAALSGRRKGLVRGTALQPSHDG